MPKLQKKLKSLDVNSNGKQKMKRARPSAPNKNLKLHFVFGYVDTFCRVVNPFHGTVLFLYPLQTSENQKFSDVFRGYIEKEYCHEIGYLTDLKPMFP